MAKAPSPLMSSENSRNSFALEAAAQIVALINSSPQSPRQDEIAAVISKVAPPTPDIDQPKHRAEWDTLLAASNAAWVRNGEIANTGGSNNAVQATEAEASAADQRLDDCARRIWEEPVHGPGDIRLLADICFRVLWSDEELDGPNADTLLDAGPAHDVSGICAEALAALLRGIRAFGGGEVRRRPTSMRADEISAIVSGEAKQVSRGIERSAQAIVDLINATPQSPTKAEIEAILANAAPVTALFVDTSEVEQAIAACEAARAGNDDDIDAIDQCYAVLTRLSEEVWSKAPSPASLRECALIAKHWHRHVTCDPWVEPSDCDDWGDQVIAHLIEAVLRFMEACRGGTGGVHEIQSESLRQAREAVAAWVHAPDDDEVICDVAHEHLKVVAQRIWATEPTSWGDVIARAVILESTSAGVEHHHIDGRLVYLDGGRLTYLDPAELAADDRPAFCDASATAHLLDAIRKMAARDNLPREHADQAMASNG
jgi:hypothetical protein